MDLPTAKQLKELAKACRAAGITSFEGQGIKFTLSEDAPAPRRRGKTPVEAKPAPKQDLGPNKIETDELGAEALLFWSVGEGPTFGATEGDSK